MQLDFDVTLGRRICGAWQSKVRSSRPALIGGWGLDARVPDHGQDLDAIRQRGILVDGKGGGKILLQRFTRRQIGPVFFEIIERRDEDGFGEGNFKALFESQETDQVKRGTLQA